MLQLTLAPCEAVERSLFVVFQLDIIEVAEIFARDLLHLLHLLDERAADERSEIEVEGRDGLTAVHLVLRRLERYAGYDACGLDAFGRARLAVSGDESVAEDIVERMLHACEALGGVVVFVVDVEVALTHGVASLLGEQVVVDERFGGLGGEFHHHSRGGIGVHVGVLAGDVVVFGLDDLEKHVAGLGAACYAALVAVGDIFFSHLFAGRLHQLELYAVLNLLHAHLLVTGDADAVGDFLNECFVLAQRGLEHGFTDGGFDFLFVVSYHTSVAF